MLQLGTAERPVFLYVDGGEESKSAEVLLRSHNIPTHVVEGMLDDGWNYPLLQSPWSDFEFEGIAEIRNIITLTTKVQQPLQS